MGTTWINGDNMLAALKNQMNAEMMAAAEPVIKKAVLGNGSQGLANVMESSWSDVALIRH